MRFVSFNVNGIRAIVKKNFNEDFTSLDADLFFLEETKLSDDKFPVSFPGYDLYFTNSKVKKGYSGVAVFTRKKPLSVHYGLTNGEYDEEGRVITLEYPSFYFVGAYVPNSGEELKRLPFRMEFEEHLLNYLKMLDSKKPVIYTGDLNVAHEEIDLKNPSTNHHSAGFTDEERQKMTTLLNNGFIDTFRHFHPAEVKYSWWSYRFHAREKGIGWRIDYFIVSERYINQVTKSEILNDIYGSDHCPVLLETKD